MLTSSVRRAVFSLATAAVLLAGAVLADGPNGEQCGAVSGGQRCGMNLCCSGSGWCGVNSDYCGSTCQSAYGSCTLPTVPSCPTSQKTATNGRRVAYWQVRQASERSCNKVLPSQIKTAGVSHLVLSFALIDANTFNVVPSTAADVAYYTQFTALQSSSLRTWVAIGGGGFSTATWTTMAATSASRAKFISSLSAFLRQYNFQGVDLDWEFPNPTGSDAQNLIALVRELRAALGSSYGISAALPADWGSVRGFNAAGMLQYLDFFNFMAYDIHGWGVDAGVARNVVTYPANVLDIATGLLPLWMSNLTPSKVNLGIPLYGRGYTLANTSCSWAPCAATGPSVSGSCVRDSSGIMALSDLKTAIADNNAWIVLDRETMQKYAVWGNQWVAYDDASTLALKLNWADSLCLGGAMFWSNDLGAGLIASEIVGAPS